VRLIQSSLLAAAVIGAVPVCATAAHTQARLMLAADAAQPGQTVMAGIQLRMDPGWHTYWKNPGGSGQATAVNWDLPAGITAGPVQWPVPDKLPDQELTTYVYQNNVVLLVPLKFAANLSPGTLRLKASVSWLECNISCIPGQGDVQAALTIGSQDTASKDADALKAAEKFLPKPASELAAKAWWESGGSGDTRPFILEWSAATTPSQADFFPEANDNFEVQPATEKLPTDPGKVKLRVQVKKSAGNWPQRILGLIIQQSGSERQGYAVDLSLGSDNLASSTSPPTAGSSSTSLATPSLGTILLYAFLGGLILNVMPCVLPVIALKILGFVRDANEEGRRALKLGVIYTLGVLASFLVLALVAIGLQAAGQGAGWGFQFSSPYFLVIMTSLVTLIALNLFGVFEVTLDSRALSAASGLASKSGPAGAFFNGLLATALATSCSAPFLGAAVGFAFALNQPALIVLILLTVGLGLAAPYLLLSWKPQWLKFLPKPGPWMEKFKIAMGFPMLGAAVWLCSLLTAHYGERAWWMAVFLVFLAVAAWVFGDFVQRGRRLRWLGAVFAVALLLIGYSYALDAQLNWRNPLTETAEGTAPKEAPKGIAWSKWSTQAVAEARSQGRPVLVDFTAKWCPTCNTIVKPTLESEAVRKKLKDVNAVALLANYTRQPPDITAELKRLNRAGVPLVLIYPRNPAEPPMVYDLVTPSTVVDALNRATQ
jgi:thiol:disulfide interchange protein DsbD